MRSAYGRGSREGGRSAGPPCLPSTTTRMHGHDAETITRDGRSVGWIRLMACRGNERELSVVCWRSTYHVIMDGAVYSSVTTQERAFGIVAGEVALELLSGGWIACHGLPEGWSMGMRFTIRPCAQTSEAPSRTSVALWLKKRGWSLREAAFRTGFSESSLRRWRNGWKLVEGERVEVSVPAYAERMMEVVDDLLMRGAEVARWEPCRMDALGFAHWVDRWPRSQARAAEMLGVSKSQLSDWVHGRAPVPVYISRLVGLIVLRQRLSSEAGAASAQTNG